MPLPLPNCPNAPRINGTPDFDHENIIDIANKRITHDNHQGSLLIFEFGFCVSNLSEIVSKPMEVISNFDMVNESKIKGKTVALVKITINSK